MSKDASQSASNPGLILRSAREELRYSVEQVARDLHLRSSVVLSMENEEYDQFSSDVFLKGYFRSYCRLVNLHEERMVELLDAQLSERKKVIETKELNALKARKAKLRKKMITVIMALAIVCGLSFYVLVHLLPAEGEDVRPPKEMSSEREILTNLDENPNDQPSSVNRENQLETAEKTSIAILELDKDGSNSDAAQESVASEKTQISNAAETLANEKKHEKYKLTSQDGQDSEVALNSDTVIAEEAVAESPQNDDANFEASFTGDCWFKLTNAKGKTVYASLKRAGDKVSYKGPSPFSIVFGDARQVNMAFNGVPVDLKSYTKVNGRAQLVLKSDN